MKVLKYSRTAGAQLPALDVISDSAVQKSGKPFFIPDFASRFDYRPALAIHINRLGKNIAPKFAARYYDAVGASLTIEATDLLERLGKEGLPWAAATMFDGAVIAGEMQPVAGKTLSEMRMLLEDENGEEEVAPLPTEDEIAEKIAYASRYFTLKIGDLLLIETECAHTMHINGHVKVSLDGVESVNIRIK